MNHEAILILIGVSLSSLIIGYIWGYASCKNDKGGDDGTIGD